MVAAATPRHRRFYATERVERSFPVRSVARLGPLPPTLTVEMRASPPAGRQFQRGKGTAGCRWVPVGVGGCRWVPVGAARCNSLRL